MINKTLICSYNKNGQCTYPGANPLLGPSSLFDISEGGCRARRCAGYTPPYKYKNPTPIYKLEVCHTPLTVPSVGPDIKYYSLSSWPYPGGPASGFTSTVSELLFPLNSGTAVTNIVSEWYDDFSYPPMISLDQGEKWGCRVSGYFQAQSNSIHTFYLCGEGYAVFYFNNTQTFADNLKKESASTFSTPLLTSGNWYQFLFNFNQTVINQAGYTVLFTHSGNDLPIPLSAGTCSNGSTVLTPGELPLTWYELPFIKDPQITEENKSGSKLKFSAPLGSISGYAGYLYSLPSGLYYCNVSGMSDRYIKKGELVRLSVGYKSNDYEDYIKRFVGHIDDVQLSLDESNENIIEVECVDFTSLTADSISKNYPTYETYWLGGLMYDNEQYGYKIGTPAFDSWPLGSVFRALFAHAGIDPSLFDKKYEFLNKDGNQVIGTESLMYPVSGVESFPSIRLERPIQYGGFDNESYGGQPDGEYFFKYGFAEKITDIIDELTENFGYYWGFRGYNDGAPFIRAMHVPNKYKLAGSFTTSGSWPAGTYDLHAFDVDAIGGEFTQTTVSGAKSSTVLTGTAVYLVCPSYNYPSSGSHLNVKINRVSDNLQITDQNIDLYNPKPWQFYDGIYPGLGYNPTIFTIASALPYEAYRISLETLYTGLTMVNAALVYERDNKTPLDNATVLSYNNTQGNIIDYNTEDSSSNNRNDIIVVGKSKGKESKNDNYNARQFYYVGRGMDVRSIYDPSVGNYVGRYKTGMIFNNRIASDERANFIAFSVLDRLRNKGTKTAVTIAGHPLLELNDAINVIDEYNNVVNNRRWVDSNKLVFDGSVVKSNLDCTDFEPYGSYIVRPDIIITGQNQYLHIGSLEVKNRGTLATVTSIVTMGSNRRTINFSSSGLNSVVPMATTNYPFPSDSFTYVNCYNLVNDLENAFIVTGVNSSSVITANKPKNLSIGDQILMPYDPYMSEAGQEFFVTINFNILKRSKLRVDILDFKTGTLVATLTGDPNANHPDDKLWSTYEVGPYSLYWAGFDQYGEYNKNCPKYYHSVNGSKLKPENRYFKGSPESGMYVSENYITANYFNEAVPQYGKFYVRFTFEDLVTHDVFIYDALDKPIYTRRGWGVFDNQFNPLINVMYFNDRHKHWAGTLVKRKRDLIHNNESDTTEFYHSIIDTDNNNNGIGMYVSSWADSGSAIPDTGPFYIPRTLKYSVKAKYYKISAVTCIDRRNNDRPSLAVFGEIAENGSNSIESSIIQLKANSDYVPTSDYGYDPRRTKIYSTVYFSPSKTDKQSFKTHAGQLVTGLERANGYELFAWLVELTFTVQDLSGKSVSYYDYFQWFGQNTYSPYSMMGEDTSFDSGLLTYPNANSPDVLYEIHSGTRQLYTMPYYIYGIDQYVIMAGTPADILSDSERYWLQHFKSLETYKDKYDDDRWFEAGRVNAQVFRV